MPVTEPVSGLSIDSATGVYSGTPANDNGDYHVTFAVRDACAVTKRKTIALKIDESDIQDGSLCGIVGPVKLITRAGSICFSFATNKMTHVTIEAFSLNGRKIGTIFKGKLRKGMQKIVWRTGNEKTAVANGIYLCRMTVGSEVLMKKIALFR
jgi:hypothetical protein